MPWLVSGVSPAKRTDVGREIRVGILRDDVARWPRGPGPGAGSCQSPRVRLQGAVKMIDVDETSLTAFARNHWFLAKAVVCGMEVPVPGI